MENIIVYHYPPCSTCKKAIKWLSENNIPVNLKHIVEETPHAEALKEIIEKSSIPLRKFFNTSGKKYRELKLKDKLSGMTIDEAVSLLAGDGMLIKRPLLIMGDTVLLGFKEEVWKSVLL